MCVYVSLLLSLSLAMCAAECHTHTHTETPTYSMCVYGKPPWINHHQFFPYSYAKTLLHILKWISVSLCHEYGSGVAYKILSLFPVFQAFFDWIRETVIQYEVKGNSQRNIYKIQNSTLTGLLFISFFLNPMENEKPIEKSIKKCIGWNFIKTVQYYLYMQRKRVQGKLACGHSNFSVVQIKW